MKVHAISNAVLAASLVLVPAITKADAIVVVVDASESSPALGPDDFTRAAAAVIAQKIGVLPTGSKVRLFAAGDDRVRAQLMLDIDIQRVATRGRFTAATLTKVFPQKLVDQVAELKLKPAHKQSELTTALLDASKLCLDHAAEQAGRNRAANCEIVFLTDGAHYIKGRVEYPRDAPKLPLPPVSGLDLKNVRVTMLGIGQAMDGNARQHVTAQWEKFLRNVGATNVVLRRL